MLGRGSLQGGRHAGMALEPAAWAFSLSAIQQPGTLGKLWV